MKTQHLADSTVLLDLSIEEHRALSRALGAVMGALEPAQLEHVLSFDLEYAYEFQYSVYLREAAARLSGTTWLTRGGFDDRLVMQELDAGAHPVVDIAFHREGSRWHVTNRQLVFLETCMSFHSAQNVVFG